MAEADNLEGRRQVLVDHGRVLAGRGQIINGHLGSCQPQSRSWQPWKYFIAADRFSAVKIGNAGLSELLWGPS